MWQWWNHCAEQVPLGAILLRLALGGTSICLFQGDAKGLEQAAIVFRRAGIWIGCVLEVFGNSA